uniref:Putative secreted protein n=1 Tax=Xenopsylla cheopis TaxID=163159 RepID=A0A6M2E2N5_XENCH
MNVQWITTLMMIERSVFHATLNVEVALLKVLVDASNAAILRFMKKVVALIIHQLSTAPSFALQNIRIKYFHWII